ncbi:hypothetical protein NIES2130_30235 [Scytonema sp. HK-05]|nr:hypothetical protein NIES2130_30235 [Scytonema sp. HK-05]
MFVIMSSPIHKNWVSTSSGQGILVIAVWNNAVLPQNNSVRFFIRFIDVHPASINIYNLFTFKHFQY